MLGERFDARVGMEGKQKEKEMVMCMAGWEKVNGGKLGKRLMGGF